MISRCVRDKKTLTATYSSDCLTLADCVVVDVQCDYTKHNLGDMRTGEVEMAALEATMRTIGEKIPADCLVVIETTVAPGTTEFVAYPIMKKAFQARGIESAPLLSHSYERVMPGKQYVASIRVLWRVCSGPSRARPARSSRTPTGPPSLPFSTSGASSPSVTVSISPKSSRPSRSVPRIAT
jgi:UDP-N-acetyl-D-glucosamine dehydrogenase